MPRQSRTGVHSNTLQLVGSHGQLTPLAQRRPRRKPFEFRLTRLYMFVTPYCGSRNIDKQQHALNLFVHMLRLLVQTLLEHSHAVRTFCELLLIRRSVFEFAFHQLVYPSWMSFTSDVLPACAKDTLSANDRLRSITSKHHVLGLQILLVARQVVNFQQFKHREL